MLVITPLEETGTVAVATGPIFDRQVVVKKLGDNWEAVYGLHLTNEGWKAYDLPSCFVLADTIKSNIEVALAAQEER